MAGALYGMVYNQVIFLQLASKSKSNSNSLKPKGNVSMQGTEKSRAISSVIDET